MNVSPRTIRREVKNLLKRQHRSCRAFALVLYSSLTNASLAANSSFFFAGLTSG